MEKTNTGTELFNKIRGRFKDVTLGNADGEVTGDPSEARFFEFKYTSNGYNIGTISVNFNDEELTVIYSEDILDDIPPVVKTEWFQFLKELRQFAKKRMLEFDVRNLNNSNSTQRGQELTIEDYKFLSSEKKTRPGEDNMNESRMYGTHRTSYQKLDNARIVVKHSNPINMENSASRSQHIGTIYIESSEGERFKYPYKHLSGARAMARHVSEGGNPYDEFGNHIIGLSEELNKLRKFKTYMGKSSVMAESLNEYMDVVNGRVSEVKKTIDKLQKPAFYAESRAAFVQPVMEDVPADVAENWIDQLTIRQFNEELKDVFPYIYRLVGEAKKVETVGLENIIDEVAGPKDCWPNYKKAGTQPGTGKNSGKRVNKCVPEEAELEEAFEKMLGQFSTLAEAEESKKKIPDWAEEADQDQTPIGKPYIKFRNATINPSAGTKRMTAYVGFAYGPEGLTPSTYNVKRYDAATPAALAAIFTQMEKDSAFANAAGAMVVFDSVTEELVNLEKHPENKYLFDFIQAVDSGDIKGAEVVEPPKKDRVFKVLLNPTSGASPKRGQLVNAEVDIKISFLEPVDPTEDLDVRTKVNVVSGQYAGNPGIIIDTYAAAPKKKEETQVATVRLDDENRTVIDIGSGALRVLSKDEFGQTEELHQGTLVEINVAGSTAPWRDATKNISTRRGKAEPKLAAAQPTPDDDWWKDKKTTIQPGLETADLSVISQLNGTTGTVLSVRSFKKGESEQKLYANQKFKDIKFKDEGEFYHFVIANPRTFFALRQSANLSNPEYVSKMSKPAQGTIGGPSANDRLVIPATGAAAGSQAATFMKYYKPEFRGFVMQEEPLAELKSLIFSQAWVEAYGDPRLVFFSNSGLEDLTKKDFSKFPPKIQSILKGTPGATQETDPTGPMSNRGLQELQNALPYSRNMIPNKMSEVPKVTQENFMSFIRDLANEKNLEKAAALAIKIVLGQTVHEVTRGDRQDQVKFIAARADKRNPNIEAIKELIHNLIVNKVAKLPKFTTDEPDLTVVPAPSNFPKPKSAERPVLSQTGMGPLNADALDSIRKIITRQSPKLVNLVPTAPSATPITISVEDLNAIKNASSMSAAKAKAVIFAANQGTKPMSAEARERLIFSIIRATNLEKVYTLLYDAVLRIEGQGIINKDVTTKRPMQRVVPSDTTYKTGQTESIAESKDHNFTPEDIQQLAKIRDLKQAKQRAFELITTNSANPLTPAKISYFTRAIDSKRSVIAIVDMMYQMLLSGEKQKVIGSRNSMEPSEYRQKFGEEEMHEGLNLKMLALLGLTALGAYKMMDNMSATNTPLGQTLQAAAEQGDTKAEMYLEKLDGLVDANNNGAVQQIAREYPPVEQESAMDEKKEKPKLKLFDFILSYYDRKTGKFPKGETAILTMVEKKYGEKYITIAKQIIEGIHKKYDKHQMRNNPQQMADNQHLGRIKTLAGL